MKYFFFVLISISCCLGQLPNAQAKEPWAKFIDAQEQGISVPILNKQQKELFFEKELTLIFELSEALTENSTIISSLLPSQKSEYIEITSENGTTIGTLNLVPEKDTVYQLLLKESEQDDQLSFTFIAKSIDDYPDSGLLVKKFFSNYWMYFLTVLAFITFLGLYLRRTESSQTTKWMIILFTSIGVSLLSYWSIQQLLQEEGLIPSSAPITLYPSLPDIPQKRLTIIDENLNLKPGIARSWSNISPYIWEFQLSATSQTENKEIISSLEEYQKSHQGSAITASIQEIIQINPSQLQIITKYPDPLLAHKLSKISLGSDRNDLIQEPDRFQVDGKVIQGIGSFNLNEEITKKNIDTFVEPPVGVWPSLFQNNYVVQPAINTESLFLLINTETGTLEKDEIHALSTKLQVGSILQTSYFQYGQLANQFAPPGITGYVPDLALDHRVSQEKNTEEEKPILSFWYPESETRLATVLQNTFETLGYQLNNTLYQEKDLYSYLINQQPDIVLVALEFDIGDIAPFLDTFISSDGPLNFGYKNEKVDGLIQASRRELNRYERSQMLQEINQIILQEDPAGIPLLFKRSFNAVKEET